MALEPGEARHETFSRKRARDGSFFAKGHDGSFLSLPGDDVSLGHWLQKSENAALVGLTWWVHDPPDEKKPTSQVPDHRPTPPSPTIGSTGSTDMLPELEEAIGQDED